MPSFQDSAVLVLLALLLFGPKKLPVLARQLGKLMADFRRASNEFRTQMEEELRISEQADRQRQVAAIEAAAPNAIAESTPEPIPASDQENRILPPPEPDPSIYEALPPQAVELTQPEASAPAPLPIATSGELSILPPATGLPVASSAHNSTAESQVPAHDAELQTETLHD